MGPVVECSESGKKDKSMNLKATIIAGVLLACCCILEIEARGNVFIQRINGIEFAELADNDSEMSRRKGFIVLQDYGKGCQVAFRNIQLKPLKDDWGLFVDNL